MALKLFAAGLLLAAVAQPAAAQDRFYAGKSIQFVVAASPGGGFDLTSRLLVEALHKTIPGSPTIVVQNMPGAGGVRGANYMFNVAARDGLVIGMPLPNIPVSEKLEPSGILYRTVEFSWIGTVSPETEVFGVKRDTGVTTLEQLQSKPLAIGATAPISTLGLNALLLKHVLGAKYKIVYGYPGGNEVNLALENGEIQGRTNQWSSWKSQKPDWVQKGYINFLVQIGPPEPELSNLPTLMSLARTPEDKAMVRFIETNQTIGRSVYAPPSVPADRLQVLRRAFDAAVADPQFKTRYEAQGFAVQPRSGADLQADIAATMASADLAVTTLKQLLAKAQ